MKPYKMNLHDVTAISLFQQAYPKWWFTVGVCDLTRDFSCAPQATAEEIKWAKIGNCWDTGFHCDHKGTIADAIVNVMKKIKEATLEEMK